MRYAALVEASEVTREKTTASVIASYLAMLPLALEELHQKAARVSREMLVETGDIASFAVPSSLIDFVISALEEGVEVSGSSAAAGNAEDLIQHNALAVMLIEPMMANNGGSVLRLGGALKRLRYHFRSRDESVEVAGAAAAAASIHVTIIQVYFQKRVDVCVLRAQSPTEKKSRNYQRAPKCPLERGRPAISICSLYEPQFVCHCRCFTFLPCSSWSL
jgi:hypothetical protein